MQQTPVQTNKGRTQPRAKKPQSSALKKRGAPQAFVQKLFQMLSQENPEVICWSTSGVSFYIHDLTRLAEDVLQKYFRHKNISSFQRQLNLYGFRKVFRGPDSGSYAHPCFQRDKPEQLVEIERAPQPSGHRSASMQRRKLAAQQAEAAEHLKAETKQVEAEASAV